jgi:hypothetical protein
MYGRPCGVEVGEQRHGGGRVQSDHCASILSTGWPCAFLAATTHWGPSGYSTCLRSHSKGRRWSLGDWRAA